MPNFVTAWNFRWPNKFLSFDCFSLCCITHSFLVFSAAQHFKLAFYKVYILRIHTHEKLFFSKHRNQKQIFLRSLAIREMVIKIKQSCNKLLFKI